MNVHKHQNSKISKKVSLIARAFNAHCNEEARHKQHYVQ